MDYVDLHTHSNASDGTCSPAEVVIRAADKGLRAIALTDHDTVSGIDKAIQAARDHVLPLQVIPGTELSVAYKKQDIHIVGLFIDHHNKAFQDMTDLLIRRRLERNEEMIRRFNANGIPVTYEELTQGNPDAVITRAHFARYLVDHQIVKIPNEAFHKYLDPGCPYFIPREYIRPEDGIRIIRDAGGVPILAHPLHYKLPEKELEALIARLKESGLLGIEVKYSNHTKQDEYYAGQLAAKFHLLPSGGSDFHGANKPAIDIGTGRGTLAVPYEYLEKLAAAVHYPLEAMKE